MMTLLTDDGGESGLNFDQFLSLVLHLLSPTPTPQPPTQPSFPHPRAVSQSTVAKSRSRSVGRRASRRMLYSRIPDTGIETHSDC